MSFSVKDACEARKQMEREILEATAKAVADFESKTGLTPNSISISMAEARFFSKPGSRYMVAGVSAEVSL